MRPKIYLGLLFGLLLTACTKDAQTYENAFAITNVSKSKQSFYTVGLTVKNTSNLNMGCWADIKMKRGNTIIDRSAIAFGSLQPGESESDEAWFSDIEADEDYDKMVVTLQWSVDSVGYERVYEY